MYLNIFRLYKTYKTYKYSQEVFKQIISEEPFQEFYEFKDDRTTIPFGISTFGVFYLFIKVPKDIKEISLKKYLNQKLSMVNEIFLESGLVGFLSLEEEVFKEEELNIHLFKYIPYKQLFYYGKMALLEIFIFGIILYFINRIGLLDFINKESIIDYFKMLIINVL
jgi:hypothetical protein